MDIEKHYTAICISVAALLAIGVWFYGACRNDVSDIGKRADDTRARLESAREEQREQAGSLDRAAEAVRDSRERTDRIEENELRDAEIIRECKSILAAVRGRGPAQGTGEG